jgi:hypothetical protein
MRTSTYFALLAEYGTAEIPLAECCQKYFGLDEAEAKRAAAGHRLPVPAHRGGSQKSQWLVSAEDLAKRIDELREAARIEWQKSRQAA